MAEIEKQFGTPLFDRVGKSLRLNDMGRGLLPQAVDLLDRAHGVEDLLSGRLGYGNLSIGATLTIGNYLAPLIAVNFLQTYPESKINLSVHNTASMVEGLLGFNLDLGMVESSCSHPDLLVEPWLEDELVVFCAPGHRLAALDKVSLKDLMQEPWIMREKGSGTRELIEQALAKQYVYPKIRLELEHTEAIKRAVESGLGVGCISRLALRDAFRRGSLVPVEMPKLNLRRVFHFVMHKQKFQTAGIRDFLKECRAFTAGAATTDIIQLPYIP
ncbi:transcriptional regulator [Sulfuriferula nivalis]|uniref:Transcriptional regulator n=1 Tax=Sulfuriferula nivalis TaxID=2675298 RepID=A0A809RFZ9_9PROT|nr:transcriptional regulator [Sulfuriferula nivalis]